MRRKVNLLYIFINDSCPKMGGMFPEFLYQIWAKDRPVAWIIFYLGCKHELPPSRRASNNQRLKKSPRCIYRSSKPSRTTANNNDLFHNAQILYHTRVAC